MTSPVVGATRPANGLGQFRESLRDLFEGAVHRGGEAVVDVGESGAQSGQGRELQTRPSRLVHDGAQVAVVAASEERQGREDALGVVDELEDAEGALLGGRAGVLAPVPEGDRHRRALVAQSGR